jgi:hypothetical protein
MKRRCFGRKMNLNRCGRYGDWWLFCQEHSKRPLIFLYALIFTVGTGVISYLSYFSETHRRLTAEQQTQFVEILKTEKQPHEEIKLGYASGSEEACVFAGQLLREAGWLIQGDKVERVILSRPLSGVAVFKRGEGKLGPSNPKSGLWVEQTPSLIALRESFAKIGIETKTQADAQMPEGVIGVFVGPNL